MGVNWRKKSFQMRDQDSLHCQGLVYRLTLPVHTDICIWTGKAQTVATTFFLESISIEGRFIFPFFFLFVFSMHWSWLTKRNQFLCSPCSVSFLQGTDVRPLHTYTMYERAGHSLAVCMLAAFTQSKVTDNPELYRKGLARRTA